MSSKPFRCHFALNTVHLSAPSTGAFAKFGSGYSCTLHTSRPASDTVLLWNAWLMPHSVFRPLPRIKVNLVAGDKDRRWTAIRCLHRINHARASGPAFRTVCAYKTRCGLYNSRLERLRDVQ